MKLNIKALEHLRIQHDSGYGFLVYIENGILHVRAKEKLVTVDSDEPHADCLHTTVVIGSPVEIERTLSVVA